MVSENIKKFVKAVKDKDIDRAKDLIDEIAAEKGESVSEKFEELSGVGPDLVQNIQMRGYNSIEKLANAPIEKLVKIPGLEEGKAKRVLDSAQDYLLENFLELPGVGEDTAREIINQGYTSMGTLARVSVEDLADIPKIGTKGAEKIREYAKNEATTELSDLPGVGGETIEEMRKHGFTAMKAIADSTVEGLTKIPNIGEKGAQKMIEYAEEHPQGSIENLPGVGRETAEEIRKHGYTAMRRVAESSVDELSSVPNIGKKGAEKILKHAREKTGGGIGELPEVDEETAKEMKKYGYSFVEDVAKSSVEDLIKIPSLSGGKALEVSESAEELVQREGGSSKGYIHALNGAVSGLEPDHDLSIPLKISEGDYSIEELKEIKELMEEMASQEFRPVGERSFHEAWADIISALIEIECEDE